MKKPFHGVEKTLEEGWKMNLNNFLKLSSYFMVFIWLIASCAILVFEFGEILDHDDGKEVQIVYRLFLVNCYLLHVPRLSSQPASSSRG